MNIHELLQDDAEELGRELEDHDPVASVRRLAVRIAEGDRPAPTRTVGRSERAPVAPRAATAPPASPVRAPQKRDHLDVVAASGRADLRRDLGHLCAAVVSQTPPETFAAPFAGLAYDGGAARVVGCLMYGLGQPLWAEFWWEVAAGADDELAAHLLAVHFAGTGRREKADLWQRRVTEVAEDRLPEQGAVCIGDPAEVAKVLSVHIEGAGEQVLLDIVGQWPATPPTAAPQRRPAVAERRVARSRSPRRRGLPEHAVRSK
ncbi:hypothetical protein [Kitasatospora sp. NPDC001527]|uniref:hypothetical protein n=1 Tax=Kitasatospora sp. NPDC001527 TaxID=3154519 RepID=UPI00332BE4EB